MDVPIAEKHTANLDHHLRQADAWLTASSQGTHTAALTYAALDLRLAIERVAAHYWLSLLGRAPEADDFHELRSFKRIERNIYALAGRQSEINKHYEFIRILWNELGIEIPLQTLNVGKLSSAWQDCSVLCHISWPLVSTSTDLAKQAFKELLDIHVMLQGLVHGMGWPCVVDGRFGELRDRYMSGAVSADDVRQHIHEAGLWAKISHPDGRPSEFVGRAVPPQGHRKPEDQQP